EDGIRDRNVTGVQTCALPISPSISSGWFTRTCSGELPPSGRVTVTSAWKSRARASRVNSEEKLSRVNRKAWSSPAEKSAPESKEIGRASCRGRGWGGGGGVAG